MKSLDELKARLATLAQEYKQIKLSSPAQNLLQLAAFTKEEAQEINAKLKQFDGIKDNAQLDEAGKILAEELKTLIPAFLAKYAAASEGQQKQLAGVKAKAEVVMRNISFSVDTETAINENTDYYYYDVVITDGLLRTRYSDATRTVIVSYSAIRTINWVKIGKVDDPIKVPPTNIRYVNIYNQVLGTTQIPTQLGSGTDLNSLPTTAAVAIDASGNPLPTDIAALKLILPENGSTVLTGTITWTLVPPAPPVPIVPCYHYQIVDGQYTYDAAKKRYTTQRTVTRIANPNCEPSTLQYEDLYAASGGDLKPKETPKKHANGTGTAPTLPAKTKSMANYSLEKIVAKFSTLKVDTYTGTLVWNEEKPVPVPVPTPVPVPHPHGGGKTVTKKVPPITRTLPPIPLPNYIIESTMPITTPADFDSKLQQFVIWLKDNPDYGVEILMPGFDVFQGSDFKRASSPKKDDNPFIIAPQQPDNPRTVTAPDWNDIILGSKTKQTYGMRADRTLLFIKERITAEAQKQGVPILNRLKLNRTPLFLDGYEYKPFVL